MVINTLLVLNTCQGCGMSSGHSGRFLSTGSSWEPCFHCPGGLQLPHLPPLCGCSSQARAVPPSLLFSSVWSWLHPTRSSRRGLCIPLEPSASLQSVCPLPESLPALSQGLGVCTAESLGRREGVCQDLQQGQEPLTLEEPL